MVDISAIAGMVSALRGATDITKAMIDLRDGAMIQSKVIELQSAILAAQSNAFAAQDERATLIAQVSQLEKEVADLKAWDAEKQHYDLQDIGNGALAYVLKDTVHGYGPPHQICANCYTEGHKSILQRHQTNIGRFEYFMCHRCGGTIWPHGGGPDYLGAKTGGGSTTFGRGRR
jgi:hypothetical protein